MTAECIQPPTLHQIADAQEILFNPEHFCDFPHQFTKNWVLLKSARGQSVDLDRIGAPSHRIQPADTLFARIRAKVRAHAMQKGYALADTPAPRHRPAHKIGA